VNFLDEFGLCASDKKVTYQWPVTEGRLNTVFGPTTPVDTNKGKSNPQHNAIDLAPVIPGKVGQPIKAMADGVVVFAGDAKDGYGNSVVIQQADGSKSRYSHSDTLIVKAPLTVTAGTVIATMGNTGKSGGVHADVRITDNKGQYIDPLTVLPNIPSTIKVNTLYVNVNPVTGVLTNK